MARMIGVEVIGALVASGIVLVACYGLGQDVPLMLLTQILFLPLAAVTGIWAVDHFVLRRRGAILILNALLACTFAFFSSLAVLYFLKFSFAAILADWLTTACVSCVVWRAADY